MTARALLEAVADEMMAARSECYAIGVQIPRTLARLWSDRIRAIASSLAEQPAKGEGGKCRVCGEDEPYTGTCGSNDPRALCKQAPQPSDPADAEKWGQQYRCGCFLGFPTKRAIPVSCPQHMRDKQGAPLPFATQQAQPPTAQRHEAKWITDLRAEAMRSAMKDVFWLSRDQVFELIGDDMGNKHPAHPDVIVKRAAHGAGAAVEAVAVLATLRQMHANSCHFRNGLPVLADHHEGEYERELAALAAVESALSTQPLPQPSGVMDVRAAYQAAFLKQGHSDDMLTMLERDVEAALHPEQAKDGCDHEWVSGDNKYVSNAEVCLKCETIRAKQAKDGAAG